jgi:hypothetical protein
MLVGVFARYPARCYLLKPASIISGHPNPHQLVTWAAAHAALEEQAEPSYMKTIGFGPRGA